MSKCCGCNKKVLSNAVANNTDSCAYSLTDTCTDVCVTPQCGDPKLLTVLVPVIYDEIDAGVSGKTARKIGFKLKTSARGTQTICVTHSAQIASLADRQLLIEKRVIDGRTETQVSEITGDDRVREIARILGGVTVSETMRSSARELIDEGKNY